MLLLPAAGHNTQSECPPQAELSYRLVKISPGYEYDSQILGGKCELETLINAYGIQLEIKSLFL
jgi:hypothetical protein